MPLCIGLTGGIGCGKSTVARLFSELGALLVDTDAISHALTHPGTVGFDAIIQRFGPSFRQADGSLDRGKLRTLIFTDAVSKQGLEAILHPLIYTKVLEGIANCDASYIVIVVPLLFETSHYLPLIQRSVLVDCPEESQVERTVKRSGWAENEVRAIMAHQLSRAARLARADDIINNENGEDALRPQVVTLHAKYSSLASKSPKS